MYFVFFIIFTTIFADSHGKYVELLPDEEKQDFLERVARRILETVQAKENPKKYSREITDDQLKEHNEFIKTILKEESEQMRRSKEIKNNTEEKASVEVKVQPLVNARIIDKEDTNTGHLTAPINLVTDITDIPVLGILNSTISGAKRRAYDEPIKNSTEHNNGTDVVSVYDPPIQKRSVNTDKKDENLKTAGSKEIKEPKLVHSEESSSISNVNQESEALESTTQSDLTVELSNDTRTTSIPYIQTESDTTTQYNNESINKYYLSITSTDNPTIPASLELITTEIYISTEHQDFNDGIETTTDNLVITTTVSQEGNNTNIKSLNEETNLNKSVDFNNTKKINPTFEVKVQPRSEEKSENIALFTKSHDEEIVTESITNSIHTSKINSTNISTKTEELNNKLKTREIVPKSEEARISSNLNDKVSTTEPVEAFTDLNNTPSSSFEQNITSKNILNALKSTTESNTELTDLENVPNASDENTDDISNSETESDISVATTVNYSEDTEAVVTKTTLPVSAEKEVPKMLVKPKKVYEKKAKNNALKGTKFQQQRDNGTELKQIKTKKKVCGLLACDYKVFEVPAEKPFLQGKPIILKDPDIKVQSSESTVPQNSESIIERKSESMVGQPYFIPVYNYSPNNAYFNPQNKLGPNIVEENTIEIDKQILRGGRQKKNLEFELDLDETRRYVGYENVDDDISDEINVRNKKRGRQSANSEPHMSPDFPNSDEDMHPYNSMKHGLKSHIQAVRQILQEKRLYHAPDQPTDYMKSFFGKTSTTAYVTDQEPTEDRASFEVTTPKGELIKDEHDNDNKPASYEFTTEHHIERKKLKHRAYEEDADTNMKSNMYLINRVKRKINSLASLNINKETRDRERNSQDFETSKTRIDAVAKILNITDRNLIISVQKLQNLEFKRNDSDRKVGVHLKVLKDLIENDSKALKQYDWLSTTVQIQTSVAKLLELITRLKQTKPIHPSDLQILKYVSFLHKQATEILKATKIRDLLRKKLALPKNRKKKKNKILKEKGLINRVWLYLRSVLPDTSVEGLSELEQFLKDIEDGLYDLHDALRGIGLVTKYDHQNWYENLRNLYLSTNLKHVRAVLLHITVARLVGMIEYACNNGLEDDYLAFIKNNKEVAKKTLTEMVFVIRIVDDVNNNVEF